MLYLRNSYDIVVAMEKLVTQLMTVDAFFLRRSLIGLLVTDIFLCGHKNED